MFNKSLPLQQRNEGIVFLFQLDSPWLESLGMALVLLATAGSLPWLVRRRCWAWLWLTDLLLLALLGALRRYPALETLPWLGWLTAGRVEYVVYGPVTILLLGLPGFQVSRRLTRLAVTGLAAVVCCEYSLGPFLGPVLFPPAAASLNREGICLQNDSFSCGPASSVTALKRLGLAPDFATIARCAHTSPAIGTPPDLLCTALRTLYPVQARTLYLESLEQIPPGEALLVLSLSLFVDHYVALLAYSKHEVVLADPLVGRSVLPRAEFEHRWRHLAVTVSLR